MSIFDSILRGKSGAPQNLSDLLGKMDLENLPQPPPGVKALMDNIGEKLASALTGQATGQPCLICGKVHDTENSGYEESNGLSGEYEYQPKLVSAIQFLPSNVGDVMAFLVRYEISFVYKFSDGEHQLLLVTAGQPTDTETDEVRYGKWVAVTGSRATRNMGYSAISDNEFRSTFQTKVHENDDKLNLEEASDSLLENAKNDALDAYGEPVE